MYKSVVVVLLISFFQGYFSLDRKVIIATYGPILADLDSEFVEESKTVWADYNIILEEIQNDTIISVNVANIQLNNLRNTIDQEKDLAVDKPNVLDCLREPEADAAALNADVISETCHGKILYPDLINARDEFATLATIPNNTILACTMLDPLPSQDELFLDCITHKILDLETELVAVQKNFDVARNVTIKANVECLSSESALVLEKVNEIYYQATVCISSGF